MSSDVDLVVLTDVESYLDSSDWIPSATGQEGRIVRTRRWGPLIERRIRLASGLLVDVGFVPPSWAATDPLDVGTSRVVADGFRILYDPDRVFGRLVAAVHE
jgi:hypothetical protein